MSIIKTLITFCIAICFTNGQSCDRHREPWHLISSTQRQLYIDGFKRLSADGKLQTFVYEHWQNAEHQNSAFLPWHRYFLWELETQIRELGGQWACFSLPYWDWTYEIEQYEYNIGNYHILNSGLSGNGVASNGGCVTGNFGPNEYTPAVDLAQIGLGSNCLVRNVCDANNQFCGGGESSAPELMATLSSENRYGSDSTFFGGYRSELEGLPHAWAHNMIGGNGHLALVAVSPDDPIFWLIHSMVDFQYSLWQDCRNHEQIDNDDITSRMYGGSGQTGLDATLNFAYLQQASWADIPSSGVTIRELHDISDWDVSYDKGGFFTRARVENNNICRGNINSNWFKDITLRRRRMMNVDVTKSEYGSYSDDLFYRLNNRMGGKGKSIKQNSEVYKTWGQMSCQYLSIENPCHRPKYFDDCSDMKKIDNDIDITLEELVEKVSDYQCMVETRKKYYNWANSTGNLYGLCRGQYDRFCDKDFRKEIGQDKCLARMIKKRNI